MGVRFVVALVLLATVIGGFIYGGPAWRFAPLGISTVWAVVELIIERRRRHTAPADSVSRDS